MNYVFYDIFKDELFLAQVALATLLVACDKKETLYIYLGEL